jgi:peroxidase
VAARGQMTMTGNGGADTFVVGGPGRINATITDFKLGVDKLQFDNVDKHDYRDVQVRQDHGNLVVTVGDDHVVLTGVNLQHQVHPHDLSTAMIRLQFSCAQVDGDWEGWPYSAVWSTC